MENLLMDFDSGIIEDILSNLLSNAIKFTPEKGNIYIQIETESIINKNYSKKLILKVKDTGIGIPEEKLTNIFERFYQIDDESTRKAEGSGIGLALVKEYIQILKGKIEVKSKINQGTEFIIELPITKEAPKEKLNYKKFKEYSESELDLFDTEEEYNTENPEEIKNGKPIVLIIEDNNDVIEYLKSIINKDYQTEIANNGDIGIKKALKNIPDIIICDVMMPEKDGYEVCNTLKEDFRTNHIPIIMLTAKADSDSKLNGLEYGADAYMVKPFNKKELLIRLQKLIELRQTLKEKYSDVVNSNFKPENPKGLNEVFLQKLLESLGQNYQDESYSIDKLCIDTAVSRAQLHRKLIALTGKSTTDFIRHYRIKKAKELLINSEPSVSEVAYNVGFKDPNYFTKSFIKETGITPSQYRANNLIMQQ
jgi:YesN/AraC family two-component response regulator